MSAVIQPLLARGPAARPRCIPPAHGSSRASSPFQSHQTVSPVHHSRETSLSLHPSTQGAFLPPRPLTNPMRIGCRQRIDAETDQGLSRRPEPTRRTQEKCLSPCTGPCTTDRSVDPRSGSVPAPRYPTTWEPSALPWPHRPKGFRPPLEPARWSQGTNSGDLLTNDHTRPALSWLQVYPSVTLLP